MLRKFLTLSFFLAITGIFCFEANAQNRDSVSAKEVNGTFRYNFTGKFKGNSNEIKILALGKGKIKIQFDLVYPYFMKNDEPMVNLGKATGEADIEGDTAVYTAENEYGDEDCRITIKFTKPGEIKVTQDSSGSPCGFGHNVGAGGTYKKISSAKPKFEEF